MENDREPVAAVVLAGECQQQSMQDTSRDAPRLVEVICSKSNAVRDPIPPSKDTFHLGQQDSAKEKFFTQERVEYRKHRLEHEKIPGTDPESS
jgi:hypothetical protein